MQTQIVNHTEGHVLCPICTHTVSANVEWKSKLKAARVAAGQRCSRCGSSLDVAVVVQLPQAA
jgi:transcription elongation factor Elf1